MSNEPELAACPFCPGPVDFQKGNREKMVHVGWRGCPFGASEFPVEMWNRRTPSPDKHLNWVEESRKSQELAEQIIGRDLSGLAPAQPQDKPLREWTLVGFSSGPVARKGPMIPYLESVVVREIPTPEAKMDNKEGPK